MKLEFSSVLPVPVEKVWEVTTDFDFVVSMNKPWLTLRYDKNKFSSRVREGFSISTSQYIFGFLPFGPWNVRVAKWQPYEYFVDIATKSPFRMWRHTHRYKAQNGNTFYSEEIEVDPGVWSFVGIWFVKFLFRNRHRKLRQYFGE